MKLPLLGQAIQDYLDRPQLSIAAKIEQSLPIDHESDREVSAQMSEYYKTKKGTKLEAKCKS